METWYPVNASSKKKDVVCLSSGESELMAPVGGACGGIATREQWCEMCGCEDGTIVLCSDRPAALGLWAMEPSQRILKVRGNSQQMADCVAQLMTPPAVHREALGL